MSSLGEESFGGIINCNTLRYVNLDPPIGGFVNNPLTGALDGGNQNITNVNALTTGTLNYTTLNPPISTGFVNNPMESNLNAGNYDIINAGAISLNGNISANGTISSVLNMNTDAQLGGNSLNVANNATIGGNTTCNNLLTLNGGLTTSAFNTSVFYNPTWTYSAFTMRLPPRWFPSVYGTVASPTALTPVTPAANITTFTLNSNTSSVIVFGHPAVSAPTYSTFEIATQFSNVLEKYSVNVSLVTVATGSSSLPFTSVNIAKSDKTPADNTKFQVVIEHGTTGYTGTQVMKYSVQLNYAEV